MDVVLRRRFLLHLSYFLSILRLNMLQKKPESKRRSFDFLRLNKEKKSSWIDRRLFKRSSNDNKILFNLSAGSIQSFSMCRRQNESRTPYRGRGKLHNDYKRSAKEDKILINEIGYDKMKNLFLLTK
jgi:hypothetical protein